MVFPNSQNYMCFFLVQELWEWGEHDTDYWMKADYHGALHGRLNGLGLQAVSGRNKTAPKAHPRQVINDRGSEECTKMDLGKWNQRPEPACQIFGFERPNRYGSKFNHLPLFRFVPFWVPSGPLTWNSGSPFERKMVFQDAVNFHVWEGTQF